MGGEASMMAANNSLKNNRNLVSKRKDKNVLSGSYANVEMKESPSATAEYLMKLREKIITENRKKSIKLMLAFGFTILGLTSISIYLLHKKKDCLFRQSVL